MGPPLPKPSLHFERAGKGPRWLFLHAAASSGAAFRPLAQRLSNDVTVLAPDLLGDGRSPAPPSYDQLVDRELEALHEAFAAEPWPVVVVGHSYGGVLALELARRHPQRVHELVLIEPVAFHLLHECSNRSEVERVHLLGRSCAVLVARGELLEAARLFVSYWSGEAAWTKLTDAARHTLAGSMRKVADGFAQLETLPVKREEYARIQVPTLLVRGSKSPMVTRWIAAKLAVTLPRATLFDVTSAGHMSPLTHPDELAFLLRKYVLASAPASLLSRA